MHDAHMETMKQKFEDAKKRMNLMQQRVRQGSPLESLRSRGDSVENDPFAHHDTGDVSDGMDRHSSFLFDQVRASHKQDSHTFASYLNI